MKMKNLLLMVVMAGLSMTSFGQNVVWKKNFGGSGSDSYYSVVAVSDGIIAVGDSRSLSFGNGDWEGVEVSSSSSLYDAIAVKYDNDGNVVWKNNFGGGIYEYFFSAIAVSDGFIAVGYNGNATIKKFDNAGNVVWKKDFGGSATDYFSSVIKVSDGIVAVGYSEYGSFGNYDWAGISGASGDNAIIVKFDNDGNVLWKRNCSTEIAHYNGDNDTFYSVTAVSDGIIAVGDKRNSFGGTSKDDAIIAKYDNEGNFVWAKTLGGSAHYDSYQGITTVSDGIVAVGSSSGGSFDNGIWAGIPGKGGTDAIIVKYDNAGNVLWKKNFGGDGGDYFEYITAVSDGFIVSGNSYVNDMGHMVTTGDWTGFYGKGNDDAIIVKYDFSGNVQWKTTFGGIGDDEFHSLVAMPNAIIAVGESYPIPTLGIGSSFGTWDWLDVTGNGAGDAIIVKYGFSNTDIPELQQQAGITVSPSPATDFVTVSGLQGNETLYFYNINGQLLITRKATSVAETVPVGNLPSGIYLLKTSNGQTVKWVKH